MSHDPNKRYCVVIPDKGKVIVKLFVSKSFIAGGDFKLYDETGGKVIENFKMTSEYGSPAKYEFITSPTNLWKKILNWQILVCSKNVDVYEGFVKIEIEQDNFKSKLTIPTRWNFHNMPPCQLKSPRRINETMVFILKQ